MAAGDITYSNVGGQSNDKAFASGRVLADADTAINVPCGFIPSRIELWYKDTGATTKDACVLWFKGMTAAYYWNTVLASGACTLTTSGGPVVYGDTSDDTFSTPTGGSEDATGQGFTIPAGLMDADSDIIDWIAWR